MAQQKTLQDVLEIARVARELGVNLSDVTLEMPDGESIRNLFLLSREDSGSMVLVVSDSDSEDA